MKKIIVITSAILLLAAACNNQASVQPAPAPQPVSQTPAAAPTPPTDPTANWKIYSNSTYSFQFKYPEDWQIETLSSAGDNSVFAKPNNEKASCVAKNMPADCIAIAVDPSSNGDFSFFVQNATTQNDLTVGGRVAKRFIIKSNEIVIIPLGGKPILSISHLASSNPQIFSNMIATFKFTK